MWGTTRTATFKPTDNHFNPRSRVGNDVAGPEESYRYWVFQSTFPRGERRWWTICSLPFLQFQSTFPRGERPGHKQQQSGRGQISIHVPAWGTTANQTTVPTKRWFQSTFPRGERRNRTRFRVPCGYFNPRSRVGNDRVRAVYQHVYTISIHVPAWGTTEIPLAKSYFCHISIHVPAWGTTMQYVTGHGDNIISIHVPAWGTTTYSFYSPLLF